jgi:hypothetical protein
MPTKPTMDLEFHPLANCLPLIEGPEFDELVVDIKERGLALAIELYEGKILDGRNRYGACLRLGIEPLIVTYAGADPAARVTSLNLRRRHLTASQRAMAAAKMANMRSGARTDLGHSVSEVSIERAADLHKVGTTSVKQAHTVLRDGAPELVAAVESGSIPVKRAAEIARQSAERQREATKALTAAAKRAPAADRSKAAGLPKISVRKSERGPWQSVRATQAREARDVRDLDEMLRVFREQVEPVYGRSNRLVRDRIKKDVAQGFERMDRSTPTVTERNDD